MNRTILTASAAASVVLAGPAAGDVLYDNGLSFLGGGSHLSIPGARRSILDDFPIEGRPWAIDSFFTKFAWADGSTGTATDFELVFYGDDGGAPNYTVYASAESRTLTETRDPNNPNFFGLTVVDIWVQFDRIILDPRMYWVDMHVVGPVNGFQVYSDYPQQHFEPMWLDYEDFGGRHPVRDIYGDDYDVNFIIHGEEIIPAPGAVVLLAGAALACGRRRRRGDP